MAAPLHAQVRGRVIDAAGNPVPQAIVDFWSAGGRVASTLTNDSGRFFEPGVRPPIGLLARRIGYLPARITATDTSFATLRLRGRETLVAGIEVSADRIRCIARDDRAGRQLWLAVRERYGPVPSRLDSRGRQVRSLWGEGRSAGGMVPPESLGILDTSRLTRNMIMTGGYGFHPFRPQPPTAENFYAPAYSGMSGGRHDRFYYPFLDSFESWHFADSLFGRWNFFGEPVTDGDSTMMEFCSRRGRNERFITGMLTIASDSSLAAARWTFVTGAERAGGEVLYAPRSPTELLPPLTAMGMLWRQNVRMVYHEWWVYDQWSVCLSDCNERRPIGAPIR